MMKSLNLTILILFLCCSFKVFALDEWVQTNGPKNDQGVYEWVNTMVVDANDNIYAGVSYNGIYKSTDNGATWSHVFVESYNVWKLIIDNNGNIFAGIEGNGIWVSTDDGTNWSQSFPLQTLVFSIACSPTNILYASTETSELYKSTDNGTSWENLTNWSPDNLAWSLIVDANENVYAGTMGGGVLVSSDYGDTWSLSGLDTYTIWDLTTNVDKNIVFAGTESEGLWEYNVNTSTWSQIGFQNGTITTVEINREGSLAVSTGGTELYVSDPDYLWYYLSSGLSQNSINDIVFQSDGFMYAGLIDDGVFKSVKSSYIPAQSLNYLYSVLCAGFTGSVSYTATGGFYPDNVFKIEMCDGTGDFDNSVIIGSVNAQASGNIDITIPNNLPYNDGYRVRLVSTNPVLITDPSDAFTVNTLIPTLSAPLDLAVEVTLAPTFTWDALSSCVTHYRLIVDNDEDFLSPIIEEFNLTASSYSSLISLQPNTTYYWKVAGVTSNDVYYYSAVQMFTTQSNTLTLASIPTTVCAGTNVTIAYTATGNFELDNQFQIELSDINGEFTNPLIIGYNVSQSSGDIIVTIPANSLNGTLYKLRLVSTNPAITTDPSSDLTINSLIPNLLLPTDMQTEVSRTPILEWEQPSTCVVKYRLLVDDNQDFLSPIVQEFDVTTNYYEILSNLAYNTTYYWKVAGVNSNDVYAYSNVFSFTTDILREVTQNISLNKGWNLISLYVTPNTPNMVSIFAGIRSKMIIAKNTSGAVYLAANNFNQIGSWNVTEGYQVYTTEACTLSVTGLPVVPEETTINFNRTGWHFIAYLRNQDMSITTALQTLTSANKMVITKNASGAIYKTLPPPTINSINTMRVGQGYQIYVNSTGSFSYPAN